MSDTSQCARVLNVACGVAGRFVIWEVETEYQFLILAPNR
jgi:hypothetical protein